MKTNFTTLVNELATILRGGAIYQRHNGYHFYAEYQTCPCRDWHGREQRKYPLHPAVAKALESDHRPHDWHLLTLEWPHVSETDSTRLAYTRDERAGIADRQVITTVGKYITRHFKTMPDHEVRNLVALYSAGESCKFVHTMAEMLYHLHRGPPSCMGGDKSFDIRCSDGERRHPYQVYDPQYGWHMAVRIDNDDTVGRALCMDDGEHGKYFVRTYEKTGGYSHADAKLHAWLLSQGYEHRSAYRDGTRLALFETSDDFLAPYIDGGEQRVEMYSNRLEIDSNGEYECGNTNGTPNNETGDPCNDCGDRIREGDGYWVGRYEDTRVCQSCCDNDYYYVYGSRGNQYYVYRDNMVRVGDEFYDEDYLSDNEIVELENGDYASMDDCVNINDEWYLCDDERVVRCEDDDEYYLENEGCWQCEESGNWYSDSVDYIEVDDKQYHPDHAPEQETTEGE